MRERAAPGRGEPFGGCLCDRPRLIVDRSELGLGPSTAEEQAWILAFLCSPAAARIIGESVVADAGAGTARMMGTFTPGFG